MTDRFAGLTRLERIGETLYPRDPSYCAEPIDIYDARWLYDHVNGCPESREAANDHVLDEDICPQCGFGNCPYRPDQRRPRP